MYRQVTVCPGHSKDLLVILEPNTHSDNMAKTDEERADTKRPRTLVKPKKRKYEVREIDLPIRLRYISCMKLTLENLNGRALCQMLRDFSKLCLIAQEIRLNFCGFKDVKTDLVECFFLPRRNKLSLIGLRSCRNLGMYLTGEEFLAMIGELQGNYRTYKIADHYCNTEWLTD